jgi:transcription termination factor Rho
MSVLSRSALEASPLADLHAIASELGIDGFRRLRKAQLVDAIVTHQAGGEPDGDGDGDGLAGEIVDEAAAEPEARPRRRRGGRGRSGRGAAAEPVEPAEAAEEEPEEEEEEAEAELEEAEEVELAAPAGRERRPGRGRERETVVEGVVELLANGSGFVRLSPPEPSDDDVYISAAQVRRCELVSGDRVAGPARRPRRSERFPSMVRIDTINGAPAEEVAEGTPYDELPCTWPSERLALDGDDPTLKAIEWLTPIGRGSRATIVGASRAGKSEALRRIAAALAGREGLEVSVVLAGVRPEEIAEWQVGPVEPDAALSFAASADAQAQAVERSVETAQRIAARGADAVVLIDSLDGLHAPAARRALAAARNLVDGGSLTIIATSARPLGGETTVIALDARLTAAGRFPALDLDAGGTVRPERLVGEEGAAAIAQARAAALGDA